MRLTKFWATKIQASSWKPDQYIVNNNFVEISFLFDDFQIGLGITRPKD